MIYHRLVVSALIFVAILFLPYWVYLPALALAVFYFELYLEGVILIFVVEILHGQALRGEYFLLTPLTLAVIILLVATPSIKNYLRFNA